MGEIDSKDKVYELGKCRVELRVNDNEARLLFQGSLAERSPDQFLNPILDECLKQGENGKRLAVLDFHELEYTNSSAIAVIVKFIERIKKSENRLLVNYDRKIKWQERSFSALEIFQTEDGRISISGL